MNHREILREHLKEEKLHAKKMKVRPRAAKGAHGEGGTQAAASSGFWGSSALFCAFFFNFCCHCSLPGYSDAPPFPPGEPGQTSPGLCRWKFQSGKWLCPGRIRIQVRVALPVPVPQPVPNYRRRVRALGRCLGAGLRFAAMLRLVPAFNQAAAAMTTRLAEGRRPSRPPRFYHFLSFFLSILLCRRLHALPMEPRGPEGLATAPGSGCICPGSSGAGVWGLRTGWTPAGRRSCVLKFLLSQGPGIFRKRRPPFVVLLAGRREGCGASALLSFMFFFLVNCCGTRGLGMGSILPAGSAPRRAVGVGAAPQGTLSPPPASLRGLSPVPPPRSSPRTARWSPRRLRG